MNINEKIIENAITKKTRAIIPVHYAGIACEMDYILDLARSYKLKVIEDAAQGMMAKYKNKYLGTIGDLGCLSFHETKNVISGEGGALIVNNQSFSERAEIIREKGTNRSAFFRGSVDKYTWNDIGSSFLPGEIIAAFLRAQLEASRSITDERLKIWDYYHQNLKDLEVKNILQRPYVPKHCEQNAHLYYVLVNSESKRNELLKRLEEENILAFFHYIPLHSSPAGKKFGKTIGSLHVTNDVANRLVRLPLWVGITKKEQDRVICKLTKILKG